jgi:Zn-dependent M16 (insulinase) family peptidase
VHAIRDFLANRRRWTISFTGSDAVYAGLLRVLESWSGEMRDEPIADVAPPFERFETPPREGLSGPMDVAHCAKVMPAPHLGHPDVPLYALGIYLLRFDYLLGEIRLKGNAYYADGTHDDHLGTFSLISFRDPHIVQTLAVFDGVRGFVDSAQWSQADIDRAIIGSAKDAVRPLRPEWATGAALERLRRGDTDALREERYQARLAATPESVKRTFLATLESNEPQSAVCVVAGRNRLEDANGLMPGQELAISGILP